MEMGLFTPLFHEFDLSGLLEQLKRYPQIRALELGTGGWPGADHVDMQVLLARGVRRREFLDQIAEAGLRISALSCHGNPLHPQREIARRDDDLLCRTVELAALLEVPTVVTFSGCPGGSDEDRTPNWVTTAWPPEFAEALTWQWEERLIPYWRKTEVVAAHAGVRIALEAHPGFCVYNADTLLRLRAATGDALGINFDPSHMWWQGVDPAVAIAALGNAIFHVHAKDVALQREQIARNGVLDPRPYSQMAERAWNFRSVGWGHDEAEWKRVISALRLAGYDGVVSIEHEDTLMSAEEGLRAAVEMLSRVVLREPPARPWWV